jgi:acetoin utilization deacetylase AcuC-like enzyme
VLRVFTSRRCLDHPAPPGFPDRPERLTGLLERLAAGGWPAAEVGGHPEAREAVAAVHDPHYLERFRRSVERGDGFFDSADNPIGAATWDAAWAAVEATLAAADWAAGGAGRRAFAAVRPPGHHAERARAMGFCFFDNVAVAADHLLRRRGLARVAVFDFDVHHGNGTQHLFEERSDVLFVSTHQYPFYPGTGAAGEGGRGPGEGFTRNLPLPAGSGDDRYAEVIRERVLPALRRHRPELLLLSAGFDAWRADPLGGMRVTAEGFAAWGRWLGELADEACGGRVLAVLEGGYDLAALPALAAGFLTALAGDGAAAPGPPAGAPGTGRRSAD